MLEQLTLDLDAFAPTRSAVISPCGRYRYRLDRRWADGPSIAWIMLNPSEVLALPGMARVQALEVTKAGQPRHPLYLRGDLTPQPWENPNV